VQLLFLVMTWEQSNNTAYLALAIMSGWGFLSWLVGTFALQSLAILAVGGALGWLANEVFRKRRTLLGIMVHDKRVWKTDFQIQDLAGPELRRVRDAAVIESNEKHDAWRRAEGKKEEVLASLGPFAAMDDNPKQELALARRKSTETANEYNRAFEKATEADERVLGVIYNKLESGQLIAEGFLPPFNAESEMTSIPAAQWRFLRFEKNMRNATGQGGDLHRRSGHRSKAAQRQVIKFAARPRIPLLEGDDYPVLD
jgi:hypothetical protein